MLHTEKEDIPVVKVLSVDTVRDYANHVGDHVKLIFQMPLGEYMTRLYPYRTNLEFTIKVLTLFETTGEINPKVPVEVRRYKAVFLTEENPQLVTSDLEQYDAETANKTTILDVKLDLLDRSLEAIRVKTVTNNFQQCTPKKIIHNILVGESQKFLIDGKPAVDGIDIVEPDNSQARAHTLIPNGTLVTGIPTFLQQKMGGVYSTGIGTYLQTYAKKKLWFVYPLFALKRFDEAKDDRLIIYALPEEKFPSLDRTFRVDGKILSVITTSTKRYQDTADLEFMNKGVGFRMADADAFMKKPVELTEEGPRGSRGRLNYEVAAENRKDNLNYAPVLPSGASSNPFKEYSRINSRQVAKVDFIWENADETLLYPGMPCKYVFLDAGKIVELKGTVVFVHALTALQGNSIQSTIYRTSCAVTILTEKKKYIRPVAAGRVEGEF